MTDFHNAAPDGKIKIAEQMSTERIKTLARRIIQRNHPLNSLQASNFEFDRMMNKIRSPGTEDAVMGYKSDTKLNCKDASKELEEVLKLELDQEQQEICNWLQAYIKNI